MWMKLLATAGLATILSTGAALAQGTYGQAQPPAASEEQGKMAPSQPGVMQEKADYIGWPIYSSDGKNLGSVTSVVRGTDGNIASVRSDIGTFLGLGGKTVEFQAGQFSAAQDRLNLSLSADQAKALPEVPEAPRQ